MLPILPMLHAPSSRHVCCVSSLLPPFVTSRDLSAYISVWGYALLVVVIISLAGLLSVAIVPLINKVFYNHLLQFLVGLAVGTLTGDAFLHLLPHVRYKPFDNYCHDSQ